MLFDFLNNDTVNRLFSRLFVMKSKFVTVYMVSSPSIACYRPALIKISLCISSVKHSAIHIQLQFYSSYMLILRCNQVIFASFYKISYFPLERDILFSTHTVFRINSAEQIKIEI